tara:strand:+ start:11268 stop:11870 length:603 start_codon:yes stop_codon:yes gene_type:complete
VKILKFLIFNTVPLIFTQNLFANTTIEQAIAELESKIETLKTTTETLKTTTAELATKVNKTIGAGIPTLNTYLKTGNCTILNNQPSNVCGSGTCYNTNAFMDQTPVSLLGYTFTAIKSNADSANRDGGIWLCDATNVAANRVSRCTSIGGNRRDGSNTVQFVIPVGASGKYIYAIRANNNISAMTNFSLCKTVGNVSLNP